MRGSGIFVTKCQTTVRRLHMCPRRTRRTGGSPPYAHLTEGPQHPGQSPIGEMPGVSPPPWLVEMPLLCLLKSSRQSCWILGGHDWADATAPNEKRVCVYIATVSTATPLGSKVAVMSARTAVNRTAPPPKQKPTHQAKRLATAPWPCLGRWG